MIKSTILKSEYESIYRLLDRVGPVPFDCGILCGSICCCSGEELVSIAEGTIDNSAASAYIAPALSTRPPEAAEAKNSADSATSDKTDDTADSLNPADGNTTEPTPDHSETPGEDVNSIAIDDADSSESLGCSTCSTRPGGASYSEEETPEMGIYLFPGEEKMHNRHDDWLIWKEEYAEDYAFPESWKGKIHFVRCKTPPHCPREKRPIQCRTFPLAPHFTESGELVMVMNDLDLPYYCPLIEEPYELDPDYLKATYLCWRRLTEDPLIRDFVLMDSQERFDYGLSPETVYPKTPEEIADAANSDIQSMLAELPEPSAPSDEEDENPETEI